MTVAFPNLDFWFVSFVVVFAYCSSLSQLDFPLLISSMSNGISACQLPNLYLQPGLGVGIPDSHLSAYSVFLPGYKINHFKLVWNLTTNNLSLQSVLSSVFLILIKAALTFLVAQARNLMLFILLPFKLRAILPFFSLSFPFSFFLFLPLSLFSPLVNAVSFYLQNILKFTHPSSPPALPS